MMLMHNIMYLWVVLRILFSPLHRLYRTVTPINWISVGKTSKGNGMPSEPKSKFLKHGETPPTLIERNENSQKPLTETTSVFSPREEFLSTCPQLPFYLLEASKSVIVTTFSKNVPEDKMTQPEFVRNRIRQLWQAQCPCTNLTKPAYTTPLYKGEAVNLSRFVKYWNVVKVLLHVVRPECGYATLICPVLQPKGL